MQTIFKLTLALAAILFAAPVLAQPTPTLPEIDRIRLAEAFKIGETLGNAIWAGWNKAPFAVLLVTPENEFLIRHPTPSQDFTLLEFDSLLNSSVYFRKRTQNPSFLATFPLGGVPTIVIGQAENTSKKTSTPWVVTVLHEHFHQLQYSQPNYFADVNGLNLSRGDETGMWMLNYPFPYKDESVGQQFGALTRLLAEALQTKNKKRFSVIVTAYLEARKKFETMLTPDDYKYFSFQVWQEGVARYTEMRMADLTAKKHKPGREFGLLKDYKPFADVAREARQGLSKELTTLKLNEYQRVAFYPLGAGEGLLLDRINPSWRSRYFADRFYLERYFSRAK